MTFPASTSALLVVARTYIAATREKHAEHGLEESTEFLEHLADMLEHYARDVVRIGVFVEELSRAIEVNAGGEAKGPLKGFSNADRRRMADKEADAGDVSRAESPAVAVSPTIGDAPEVEVDPVPETARAVLELMASKGRYLIELTLFEEFGDSDERQILNEWLSAGMPMGRPAPKAGPIPKTALAVLELMASKNKHVIGFMFEEFEDPDEQQIIGDWLYAGMPTGRESAQASEESPDTELLELLRMGEFPTELAWVLDREGLHVQLRIAEIERLAMALKGGGGLEILVRLRSSGGERA